MIEKQIDKELGIVPNSLLGENEWEERQSLNMYALISANLMNFLPQLNHREHLLFFNKYKHQQLLNGQDVQFFEGDYPLAIDGWNEFENIICKQRGIIATYHFGSFQLINYLMIRAKIPYVLLVAGKVKMDWAIRYPQLIAQMDKAHENGNFQLLDANDPSSLRSLYHLLDKGFNLLIYADGIEGIDYQKMNRMSKVNFLGQEIYIPKGTATLAHRFNLPIYPCLMLRYQNYIKVEVGNTIYSYDSKDLQHYAQFVADRIFTFLAKYVIHWPEQWTNWPMLHRFLLRNMPIGATQTKEDDFERYFGLFCLDRDTYLLEKRSYRLFPLESRDFNFLKSNWF